MVVDRAEPGPWFRADDLPLSRRRRSERLIAVGRLVLAAVAWLALRLDSTSHYLQPTAVAVLVGGYAVYAAVLALVAWRAWAFPRWLGLASLAVDLASFSALALITEGSTSPYFLFFVFAVASATVRWPGRGTLSTALAALVAYVAIGAHSALVLDNPAFELHRFLLRVLYLGVLALLLGVLGGYYRSLQLELERLARWPRKAPREPRALLTEALDRVGEVLGAGRLVLLWEDSEEPWVHLAIWQHGSVELERLPPGELELRMPSPLAGRELLCLGRGQGAVTVYEQAGEPKRWPGRPFSDGLERLLACENALALPFEGGGLEGLLVACDPPRLDQDALATGRLVARMLASRLDQLALWKSLRQGAADQERIRLARDLHDGVLQSLAAAALELETVSRQLQRSPAEARCRVVRVQELLAGEQRQLRQFVDRSRHSENGCNEPAAVPFEELDARLREGWSLAFELRVDERLARARPEGLPSAAFCVLREALSNAARHARAKTVGIDLDGDPERVRIRVTDDGRGFAFLGRRDLVSLVARNEGPRRIRERVAELGGELWIESSVEGSVLEIELPDNPSKEV